MNFFRASLSFFCFFIPLYAELSLEQCAQELQLPLQEVQRMFDNIIKRQDIQEGGKGWSKYYHLLPNNIKQREYSIGCEVGVAYGGHSIAILSNTEVQKLYSIDPYLEYGDKTNGFLFRMPNRETRQKYWDLLYTHVCDRLSIFEERSCLLRMTSLQAAEQFQDESLDFVFLDANHSFESVMQDLNAWFDKIKPGGMFCGDDYASSRHPGVTRAVNQFFKNKEINVNARKPFERFWWIEKS